MPELEAAETFWIIKTQQEAFREQFIENSTIRSFASFKDEQDLVGLGGRLQYSNLKRSEQQTIILPSDHAFTELLIDREHRRILHAEVREILTLL